MPETDLIYSERRAAEELIRSGDAASPEAASAHRALALLHRAEAGRLRAGAGKQRMPPG